MPTCFPLSPAEGTKAGQMSQHNYRHTCVSVSLCLYVLGMQHGDCVLLAARQAGGCGPAGEGAVEGNGTVGLRRGLRCNCHAMTGFARGGCLGMVCMYVRIMLWKVGGWGSRPTASRPVQPGRLKWAARRILSARSAKRVNALILLQSTTPRRYTRLEVTDCRAPTISAR
ncbi:hypothetical protein BT67DRAFT_301722 [Trichocladium antarcticum]|uniref:Uncharacterized protein n=1 Tax=Trichocladium antarcticum TaxID=1450529 RepID=A0AAN6UL50_9PEZI|nr:hypothetical protein BT67DRAFT_301722 [Trichocladium antarcticum]